MCIEQLLVAFAHEVVGGAFVNRLGSGGGINLHMAYGAEYMPWRDDGIFSVELVDSRVDPALALIFELFDGLQCDRAAEIAINSS
jgi:hypothetical protein